MKKNNLYDEFKNDDINHFTFLDMLKQLYINGQSSNFSSLLKTITSEGLLKILRNNYFEKSFYIEIVEIEILLRIENGK